MSVLNRLKDKVSFTEKASDMNTFNPEALIPEDKQQIVDKMPELLGVTMTSGALLDAIYNASRARIIQIEYPDSEELKAQAQALIDLSMRDLGHKSQQILNIHHVAKPHAEMAESVFGEISFIVDRAYGLAVESTEGAQAESSSIGPISVNQPVSDSSIAA